MKDNIIELKNITMEFPGVKALDNVSFGLREGEIHALCGENGAGKSTLIKILTGVNIPTSGQFLFEGKPIENSSPANSMSLGIYAIYQEFNLLQHMTVAENIFFGQEIKKNGVLCKREMVKKCRELTNEIGVDIDPNSTVNKLSVAHQQIVEIARILNRNIRVLIMDEPTAPLTENEINILFKAIKKLKDKGVSIIYISHRLEEIFELADRITVIRDGQYIQTSDTADTTNEQLISLMVGRTLGSQYPEKSGKIGNKVLSVKNLTNRKVKHVSFDLYKGEILGIAGMVGSGRTEMVRALYGADPISEGKIEMNGKEIRISSPREAIRNGIGLIPEDRKNQGLYLQQSIRDNVSCCNLKAVSGKIIMDRKKEADLCTKLCKKMAVKMPSIMQKAVYLSGGNQQKVILAKWLATDCSILIFDEPTRGIDVGAKKEIYELMRQLTNEGKSIIMISSEMPELIGMSDRVLVMRDSELTGEIVELPKMTQENILKMAIK